MTEATSFRLDGRVALVTGGGAGLGEAISLFFAEWGATVIVVDIDQNACEAVADRITQLRGRAVAATCDVSDERAVVNLVQDSIERLGRIDILVANAGIGLRSPAESVTSEQWDRVMSVNLRGSWLINREVGRHMIENQLRGSIINMASVSALIGLTTGISSYSASKGALIALTRTLAMEWAPHGIRVNAIAPTHFRTSLVSQAIEQDPRRQDYFEDNIPLGRLGEPEDIVGAALYLASSASSMVTGHVLAVDGGHSVGRVAPHRDH